MSEQTELEKKKVLEEARLARIEENIETLYLWLGELIGDLIANGVAPVGLLREMEEYQKDFIREFSSKCEHEPMHIPDNGDVCKKCGKILTRLEDG